MPAAPSIEFREVRKSFRMRNRGDSLRDALPRLLRRLAGGPAAPAARFTALDGVSFAVSPGEVLGVVGANGAGKSTTLRLVAGVYRPDGGEVIVRGRVAALIELSAGFHPDLSGRENIYLNGALLGMRRREMEALEGAIVAFAGIGEHIDAPVRTYSSGMVVRLGFAVAAHVPADILLVDEVLSVGDIEFRQQCLERMTRRRQEGTAILFVSHNLKVMEQFCDRVLVVRGGKVLVDGEPRRSLAAYREQVASMGSLRAVRETAAPQIRKGTGEVVIEGVLVDGGEGTAPGAAPKGGTLRVGGRLRPTAPVPSPLVAVSIHSSQGVLCTRATVDAAAAGFWDPAEGGTFTAEFPGLSLHPGAYEVSVLAFAANAVLPYDHHQQLYPLEVQGDAASIEDGLVDLPVRWGGSPGA
ncbi:MAG: ABC transporter ATP-binding protein [Planctomycetes bacterium]|nr:ABC transporter ATP-binding protein [Planctomycetota bacterium]